jgi:hypothetical protein
MTLHLPVGFSSNDITLWGGFGSPLGIYGTHYVIMAAYASRAKAAIEKIWQGKGVLFPNLTLKVFVDDAETANARFINSIYVYDPSLWVPRYVKRGGSVTWWQPGNASRTPTGYWAYTATDGQLAHEGGHLLGLPDEYTGKQGTPARNYVNGMIMVSENGTATQQSFNQDRRFWFNNIDEIVLNLILAGQVNGNNPAFRPSVGLPGLSSVLGTPSGNGSPVPVPAQSDASTSDRRTMQGLLTG